jgi:hypothetical protein
VAAHPVAVVVGQAGLLLVAVAVHRPAGAVSRSQGVVRRVEANAVNRRKVRRSRDAAS